DRQYTVKTDNLARRSAQTAMYHVLEAMTRWMAPILSFTADEIWACMPKDKNGERAESVFLTLFYQDLFDLPENSEFDFAYWQTIEKVREVVSAELEKCRTAGEIGSSLDAEVTIYASEKLTQLLAQLGDELRFVLITSSAKVLPLTNDSHAVEIDGEKMVVEAAKSTHAKCERCWHYREDVGNNEKHPDLCNRCIDNVEGAGEVRHYA
ncbi:MAG: isoleucine--tRNA ligase, partial [Gammaproteobacteria bacterium]